MKRLSGADAFFLYSERPTWPMHIGSLMIVDSSEAPGFGYDAVRRLLTERINEIPEFTMKVKEVPLGLGRPLLIDDPEFDIDHHVHRTAVPPPGGRPQLAALVGDMISVRLDRRRPLWDLWVIEGLEDGRVAILTKVHHALGDGVSAAGLAAVLCDLEAVPPVRGKAPRPAGGRVPSDVELAALGALSAATSPPRLAAWAAESAVRMTRRACLARRQAVNGPLSLAPRVPWNGTLTKDRNFAFVSVPLEVVKAIGHRVDVTVNDVILAVCAGTLRRWLLVRGCLPPSPLLAAVPVSMRSAGDRELGNKLSTIFVPLSTQLADPVERLRLIAASADAAKAVNYELLRGKKLRRLSGLVVPSIASLGWRAFVAAGLEDRMPLPSDLVVSNVRGSSRPLYIAGARIVAVYPVPPAVLGQGLDITVISYMDSVDFGFTVDRQKISDPWELAGYVPESLDELAAALALPSLEVRAAAGSRQNGRGNGAVTRPVRRRAARPPAKTTATDGQNNKGDQT